MSDPTTPARPTRADPFARVPQGASAVGRTPVSLLTSPQPAVATTWVSLPAVRAAVGSWGAGQGLAGRRLVADVGLRTAIGVASAVLELMRDPAWTRWPTADADGHAGVAVREDIDELARRSGIAPAAVREMLDALAASGVVERVTSGGETRVRLVESAQVVAPSCARIDWAGVRRVLEAKGEAIAAPLAVLRALATRADEAAGDMLGSRAFRASVRTLADDTHFGRSTVAEAIAVLVRAELLVAASRAGQVSRFKFAPAVFGGASALTTAPAAPPAVAAPASRGRPSAPPTDARPAREARVAEAAAPVLLGTFGETPIYAPPGTTLTLERDTFGGWVCRVGAHLRLGPIAP